MGAQKHAPIPALFVGSRPMPEGGSGTKTAFGLPSFGFTWKPCFPNARCETQGSGRRSGEMHDNNEVCGLRAQAAMVCQYWGKHRGKSQHGKGNSQTQALVGETNKVWE